MSDARRPDPLTLARKHRRWARSATSAQLQERREAGYRKFHRPIVTTDVERSKLDMCVDRLVYQLVCSGDLRYVPNGRLMFPRPEEVDRGPDT